MKKTVIFFFFIVTFFFVYSVSGMAEDRGTFIVSGGYNHHLMFTTDNSSSGGDDGNIDFGGGYGFYLAPGYQGDGRWGFQMPMRFSYHTLDGESNVYFIGGDITPMVRLFRDPKAGWDPYFAFGMGLDLLTEGSRKNNSGSFGLDVCLAAGVEYHFHDNWAARLEVPFRAILFVGDNLSEDTTAVTSIPISLGITWKF